MPLTASWKPQTVYTFMSFLKEIYSDQELESIIKNGVIEESFWVNSTSVNNLSGVTEIRNGKNGVAHFKQLNNLGELKFVEGGFSFFGPIISLNNLQYIGGTLRYGAPLKSLKSLSEIGGDFRPTTNDLISLGNLEKVGGTVDLRGMINLTDLSNLRKVGGNLNLVRSLKDQYDLRKIKVSGRIIYWNTDPVFYKHGIPKKNIGKIPPWENISPYLFENNLVTPSKDQQSYYQLFKKAFLKGEYIDVAEMRSYIRYLIYDLTREYQFHKNFELLVSYFEILRTEYPNLSHDAEQIEVEIGRKLELKKYVDFLFPYESFISWDEVKAVSTSNSDIELKKILDKRFVNSSSLTFYGNENKEEILGITIEIIREFERQNKKSLGNQFFDNDKFYVTLNKDGSFNPEYYKIFYESPTLYESDLAIHNLRMQGVPKQNKLYPNFIPVIVELSFIKTINKFLREAENQYRVKNNLPRIGEGWLREVELFYKIKNEFNKYEVIHQGKPRWLGLQRFDIYLPLFNIAIEYQGDQHFKEVELFGGNEGLIRTQENDKKKREKCNANNCTLIEVLPTYNFEEVKKTIHDIIENRNAKGDI